MLIKFKSFLHRFRRQLASTKRHKQLLDSVSAPDKGFGRSEWVLSRPLYRYARFELKSVPSPSAPGLGIADPAMDPFRQDRLVSLVGQGKRADLGMGCRSVEAAILENKLRPKSTAMFLKPCCIEARSRAFIL